MRRDTPAEPLQRKKTLMVSRRALIGISALVWLWAGYNVLRIGVAAYGPFVEPATFALTAAVFAPFFVMFQKLARENRVRISNMPTEKNNPFTFFTVRSYVIIALMMTLGLVLRGIPAVPRFFIAFFYVGLGSALFLAGASYVLYLVRFDRYAEADTHAAC